MIFSDGTQGILRTDSHPQVQLLDFSNEEETKEKTPEEPIRCLCHRQALDTCYDILCDNDFYQVSLILIFDG